MDGAPASLDTVEIQELLELLPHRHPFLLIDRIINIDGMETAVGIKNVTATEPHFAGHFPDRPIMPGVLLLEGMAQTVGAVCIRQGVGGGRGQRLVYLMSIDEAKFRKPVVPGDVLEYHIRKQRVRATVARFGCEAKVAGATVAEAVVTAMLVEK